MNIREKLRSPRWIFIFYLAVASLLIMIFRFIFPGSEAPLIIYSRSWRLLQGVLEIFNFFPALALSALVIPFGLASYEENYQSFSDIFFKRMANSVVTAIFAAIIYSLIFFLALPLVKNQEENLRFSGELYQLAKKNMHDSMNAGDWYEASQFVKICDRIWLNSPELAEPRVRIAINLEEQLFERSDERAHARAALTRSGRDNESSTQTGFGLTEDQNLLNSTEAIALSTIAYSERRYFDAHWLANLGMRLAPEGSAQRANAARLASDAWNMISSLAPNQREERLFELYNLKLSGYQAMNSEKWIDAYYIFHRLVSLTPDDPDAVNFLTVSERNANEIAFFIDEMNLSLGEISTAPLFSLPSDNGRAIIRFSTLTTLADVAYGIGFEYMKFDARNNLQASVISRYAKLLPIIVDDKPQVLVQTHALDRQIEEKGFKGEWLVGGGTASSSLQTTFTLDISFEDFILVSHVRRGLTNLQIGELFEASRKLNNAGYISQIFQAEVLNRLGSALFFLPMAILIIVIAWRYRAKSKPRYLFILLLPILPIVLHGFVYLYRAVFNTLGIWLVLTIGFIPAIIIFIVVLTLLLFISLLALASQRS